jgi:DNA helicase II / ATP-dependent DNA helicase PcrA
VVRRAGPRAHLNQANLNFVRRSVAYRAGTVVVGVGDGHQSIYGFRGARSDAMERFAEMFRARALPLTYCFRCPRRVVFLAQQIDARIRAPASAAMGRVEVRYTSDTLQTVMRIAAAHRGAPITLLCRHNRTHSGGRAGAPGGRGHQILDVLAAAHRPPLAARYRYRWLSAAVRAQLDDVVAAHGERPASALLALLGGDTVDDGGEATPLDPTVARILRMGVRAEPAAPAVADSPWIAFVRAALGDPAGPGDAADVVLATIHAVKGLEFAHVAVLDYNLIGLAAGEEGDGAALEQERNLCYVAVTRATHSLAFILSTKCMAVPSAFLARDILHRSAEWDGDDA